MDWAQIFIMGAFIFGCGFLIIKQLQICMSHVDMRMDKLYEILIKNQKDKPK